MQCQQRGVKQGETAGRLLSAGDSKLSMLLAGYGLLRLRSAIKTTSGILVLRHLEAHLFDWAGDLYGQRVRVGLVERLRGELKFDGVDSLVAQIQADASAARESLASGS